MRVRLLIVGVAIAVAVVGGCGATVAPHESRKLDAIAAVATDLAAPSSGPGADSSCLSEEQRAEYKQRFTTLVKLHTLAVGEAFAKPSLTEQQTVTAAATTAQKALEKCEADVATSGTLDASVQCSEQRSAVASPSRDLPRTAAMMTAMMGMTAQLRAAKRLRDEYPPCVSQK
jgi:hypothetical protein